MSENINDSKWFTRADWLCAGIAALVAFLVYYWTTAPNVTLLDSGEFIVAAQHFGVPHPTGYPLWTLLGWLFQLLPLGNAAWEINLLSGILGAAATGLAALLIRSSNRWMCVPNSCSEFLQSLIALSISLTFAFSFSMWSQAVIAEVYTLHALLIGFFFLSLYAWLRMPTSETPIYWVFFTLSLAFSNHHLTLVLAPLPFLVAMLIRRDLLPDLLMASMISALVAYLGFAALADNPLVLKAALRLGWLIGPVFVIFLLVRRMRVHLRLIVFLPFVLALGMLPYAYLPIASFTNPPMNWGYTRTLEGFFASFNRSQYQGSLSDQSLRVLTNVVGMGSTGPTAKHANSDRDENPRKSVAHSALQWATFFWQKLIASFSPISFILFFGAAFAAMRLSLERRVWYYSLLIGFALAAFLQPTIDRAQTNQAGWWLQMPYHTYTNFIFALACGIGACFLISLIPKERRIWQRSTMVLLGLMPVWALVLNADGASQRHRWLGWKYGYDMLHALPAGAIVFGGTDPGRFVPTYMIFGESSQDTSVKRVPEFDRRDLYIITQNATADPLYLSYLRDHYHRRPDTLGAFQKWLGRDQMYPKKSIILPTIAEAKSLLNDQASKLQDGNKRVSDNQELADLTHGAIARWIFEKNKDNHRFYVEESYPMKWSYDHAIPSGLLYEIARDPLAKIPPDAIEADMQFWKIYVPELLNDPGYSKDFDAHRSFSKLRLTSANIYLHRDLMDQAKQAAIESIALWPGHLEAIRVLSQILWKEGDYETPVKLSESAFNLDPNNSDAAALFLLAHDRRDAAPKITAAVAEYRSNPKSVDAFRNAVKLIASVGDRDQIMALQNEATPHLKNQDEFLALMINLLMQIEQFSDAAELAELRANAGNSSDLWIDLAAIQLQQNDLTSATRAIQNAHRMDATKTLARLAGDPFFAPLKEQPEIKNLIHPLPTQMQDLSPSPP